MKYIVHATRVVEYTLTVDAKNEAEAVDKASLAEIELFNAGETLDFFIDDVTPCN